MLGVVVPVVSVAAAASSASVIVIGDAAVAMLPL